MTAQCLCRGGRWNEGTGQIAFARLPRQAALALRGAMANQQIRRINPSFIMLAQITRQLGRLVETSSPLAPTMQRDRHNKGVICSQLDKSGGHQLADKGYEL